jgi:hypothetical protein
MQGRRKWVNVFSALFFFVYIFTIYIHFYEKTSELLFQVDIQNTILKSRTPIKSQKDYAEIVNYLSQNPYSADYAALLFIDAGASNGIGGNSVDEIRSVLKPMGWRSTSAQFALLVDAAKADKSSEVLLHADALLRRGKLKDFGVALLQQVEQQPQYVGEFAAALGKKPNWRRDYLLDTKILNSAQGRRSRYDLLTALMKNRAKLERIEVTTAINYLADKGDVALAHTLWQRLGKGRSTNALSDPAFAFAQKIPAGMDHLRTPFDWRFFSGVGYQTSVTGPEGAPAVRIEWDGRGVPLFVAQTLDMQPISPRAILVKQGSPDIQALRQLVFLLSCDGQQIELDFAVNAVTDNGVRLDIVGKPDCRYPQFQIKGRLQPTNRSLDIAISSITSVS